MRSIAPLVFGALALLTSAVTSGCATDTSSETANVGTVRLPLETVNGEFTYRLVNAQLAVIGPENQNVQTDPQDEFVLLSVLPGEYSVTLQPGWQLQRIDAEGATTTMSEAVLTSENPITVDVEAQAITELYFAFDVSGMGIEFGDGGLQIGISVCDDPEGCSETTPGDGDGDGDSDNPLLSAGAAFGALCPGGTVSLGGEDTYVFAEITDGAQQGDYEGEMVTPIAGATRVLGTCNSFSRPTAAGGGGAARPQASPWYFFLPVTSSLVYLSSSWNRGEVIQSLTFHYFDGDPAAAGATETQAVELSDARVWGIERLVVPDPANPGSSLDFVRVQVGYDTMNWESLESNTLTTLEEGPAASVPFETPACSGADEPMYRYFLTVDNTSLGDVPGDATFPGEEGTVEVFGVCHSSYQPSSTGGGGTARPVMAPLSLVKKTDSSTANFLQMFNTNSRSDLELRGYRETAPGEFEHEVTYELEDAQLTTLEQTSTDGSDFERLEYSFSTFNLIWEPGGNVYNYSSVLF